jgi:hypothetical protein
MHTYFAATRKEIYIDHKLARRAHRGWGQHDRPACAKGIYHARATYIKQKFLVATNSIAVEHLVKLIFCQRTWGSHFARDAYVACAGQFFRQ